MNESNDPSERVYGQVHTEAVVDWAQYPDPSDLSAFRLIYDQANDQTRRVVAQHFFSTVRTSLMGLDLPKLEALAKDEELREYVKVIRIEDDFDWETTPS